MPRHRHQHDPVVDLPFTDERAQFVAANRVALVNALTVRTGDRHTAEELAQEAFVRLWRNWDSLLPDIAPTSLLYKIAFDLATSWWRRHFAHRRALEKHGRYARPPAAVPSIIDARVRQAISSLPRRQAEVVVLRFVCDFSVDQTADALGIAPGSVKTHTSRALARLRHELDVEDFDGT